jgi:hypothetical protein
MLQLFSYTQTTHATPFSTEDSPLCAQEPLMEIRVSMYLLIGVPGALACRRATASLMNFQSIRIKSSTAFPTGHQMRLKNTISRVLKQANETNA